MPKKTVVILYEYFFPGYKAGGPIQSLVNMILTLQHEYDFKVITTAYDLNAETPYKNVQLNSWNEVLLTEGTTPIKVWYSSTKKISNSLMLKTLKEAQADFIFVNGLFTNWFFQPLWLKRTGKITNAQIIISPRGMLQEGALKVKAAKKKTYLQSLKFLGLFNNVRWHSTNNEETKDIVREISKNAIVAEAANVPKVPLPVVNSITKKEGELSLVYLSIITPKKNLLLLLEVLKTVEQNISLDIYGPIKENSYWQQCQQTIETLPLNIKVNYKGDVEPNKVQQTIQQYHVLVSLTGGENFGHALYESFSCGRPIITSYFTPWNNLDNLSAGWNTDIHSIKNIGLLLQQIAKINQLEFDIFCNGALELARQYYYESNFEVNYKQLFL